MSECPSPKRLTRGSLRNHSLLESDPFFGNSCSQHSHSKFDAEQPEQLNSKIIKEKRKIKGYYLGVSM